MEENQIVELGPFDIPELPSRPVRLFLPTGFKKQKFRVLMVMFDGQNIFDDEHSFSGGWHMQDLISRLSPRAHFRPAIVGIHHGGESRLDELAPFRTEQGGGKLDLMLDWTGNLLLPMLREELDIVEGPLGAIIVGSSMGGLASLYAHFTRPTLFGGALVMSPSLWFGKDRVFESITSCPTPNPSRIYFDWGTREGREMSQPAHDMAAHLEARGYSEEQLMIRRDLKGKHTEADWQRRMPRALRFMFAKD
ncbi:MAG: alpha/beta hydrolase-fold protein [Polyangiaceae bacterium]